MLGQGTNLLQVFAGDGVGFTCVVLKAHGIVFGVDNGLLGADVNGVILGYGNVLGATGGEHKGAHHQGKDQGDFFFLIFKIIKTFKFKKNILETF